MGVEVDMDVVAQKCAGSLDCLVNDARRRRAGGVFEAKAVERNFGVEDLLYLVLVKLRRMSAATVDARGKTHHGDGNFVFQTGVVYALSGPAEVFDVV